MVQCVFDQVLNQISLCQYFGFIMDETSDISKTEQVSMCFRYIFSGITKESFVLFFSKNSINTETLYI